MVQYELHSPALSLSNLRKFSSVRLPRLVLKGLSGTSQDSLLVGNKGLHVPINSVFNIQSWLLHYKRICANTYLINPQEWEVPELADLPVLSSINHEWLISSRCKVFLVRIIDCKCDCLISKPLIAFRTSCKTALGSNYLHTNYKYNLHPHSRDIL